MDKIKMTTPLVEMDGDEMTRILWAMIKDKLILPFVDLKTEYYDLGLLSRNATGDQITVDAANAARRLKELLGCERVVAFGDAINDLPMFEISDACYAVENAVEELKAAADGVIGSNENDGVAKWLLEHFASEAG